jgi:hypothetical protein
MLLFTIIDNFVQKPGSANTVFAGPCDNRGVGISSLAEEIDPTRKKRAFVLFFGSVENLILFIFPLTKKNTKVTPSLPRWGEAVQGVHPLDPLLQSG